MRVSIDKEKLKMIMFQKRMTASSLTQKLGLSKNMLSTVFKEKSCSEKTAWRIADALEVPAETFAKPII